MTEYIFIIQSNLDGRLYSIHIEAEFLDDAIKKYEEYINYDDFIDRLPNYRVVQIHGNKKEL